MPTYKYRLCTAVKWLHHVGLRKLILPDCVVVFVFKIQSYAWYIASRAFALCLRKFTATVREQTLAKTSMGDVIRATLGCHLN